MANEARPLSPSQVNGYLDCSARWYFCYVEKLPDPPGGSLVRGRAVHKLVNHYFKYRMEGDTPDVGQLGEAYEEIWERETADAAFGADENIEELKRSGAELAAKYLSEAAPEIEPAFLDVKVEGEIGGIPVRGYIDLIDVNGRIVDLKTASRKPSGVSPDYAFQVATYSQLAPGASGEVRLDTVVATKTPQLISIGYQVSDVDRKLTERLYPHVQKGMEAGLYFPNRRSNLCSRKYCPYAEQCIEQFGGCID